MALVELTAANFEEEVLNASGKVLVDVWAPWCGPCKMLSPIVDEVAEEVTDVKVAKLNADDAGEIAAKYKVSAIPTLLVFEGGEVVKQSTGLVAKEKILELIQ